MSYSKDSNGVWWYIDSKQRTRCKSHNCDNCGELFYRVRLNKDKPNYCSKICSNEVTASIHRISRLGEKNANWGGGRKIDGNGYVKVYKPDHPNRDNHRYVFEHRVVMEEMIGRYLHSFETVHHKNGKRDDNRPNNLELFVSKHPAGQRPEDLLKWAEEIISLYKTKVV